MSGISHPLCQGAPLSSPSMSGFFHPLCQGGLLPPLGRGPFYLRSLHPLCQGFLLSGPHTLYVRVPSCEDLYHPQCQDSFKPSMSGCPPPLALLSSSKSGSPSSFFPSLQGSSCPLRRPYHQLPRFRPSHVTLSFLRHLLRWFNFRLAILHLDTLCYDRLFAHPTRVLIYSTLLYFALSLTFPLAYHQAPLPLDDSADPSDPASRLFTRHLPPRTSRYTGAYLSAPSCVDPTMASPTEAVYNALRLSHFHFDNPL